jgi:hypothetical protein
MERREKVMFAVLIAATIFVSANPKSPEFHRQLKGALGRLMAWVGVGGMLYGIVLTLPSIAHASTTAYPDILPALMLVVSGVVGVVGLGMDEEHSDHSPSDPKPCLK